MLLAEFGWPHAVTIVGLAFAAAFAWAAFFWALSREAPQPRRTSIRTSPMWTYDRGSTVVDEADDEEPES